MAPPLSNLKTLRNAAYNVVKRTGSGLRLLCFNPVSFLSRWVTLGKSLNCSLSQAPHSQNGNNESFWEDEQTNTLELLRMRLAQNELWMPHTAPALPTLGIMPAPCWRLAFFC